jgi:hypothetical protein
MKNNKDNIGNRTRDIPVPQFFNQLRHRVLHQGQNVMQNLTENTAEL